MAIGAMLSIKKRGLKMPGDIGLVGFNNEPVVSLVTPMISSVEQPSFDLGKAAAKLFIEAMHDYEGMRSAERAVSYTHLDVYKRQTYTCTSPNGMVVNEVKPLRHFFGDEIHFRFKSAVRNGFTFCCTHALVHHIIGHCSIYQPVSIIKCLPENTAWRTCLLYTSRCV